MTLAELAITVGLLAGLGLLASRLGLSAIPAYLFAGLLLGPNEPKALSLMRPSEVTDFVAEIGHRERSSTRADQARRVTRPFAS
jgi:monovalent cation:H+ antiporter-2, CPA2 family